MSSKKIISSYYSWDPMGLIPEDIDCSIITHLICGESNITVVERIDLFEKLYHSSMSPEVACNDSLPKGDVQIRMENWYSTHFYYDSCKSTVDWLFDWLDVWLIDWLIDWLICWFFYECSFLFDSRLGFSLSHYWSNPPGTRRTGWIPTRHQTSLEISPLESSPRLRRR